MPDLTPDAYILLMQVSEMERRGLHLDDAGFVALDGYQHAIGTGPVASAVQAGVVERNATDGLRITPAGKQALDDLGATLRNAFR